MKWTSPMNLACTILNACGVYLEPFHMSVTIGVIEWDHIIESISSCQYPLQLIKGVNPVAQHKWAAKNVHVHVLVSFNPYRL